jgi:putative ABC transport system substrate-binding protein
VVGYLGTQSPDGYAPFIAAFHEGLKAAGYVAGQNVTIEFRWANAQDDRLPALAADLVGRKVNVIATTGGLVAALAAKAATTTIPVVFAFGGDPVERGLVASYNKPGGNVTGVTNIAVSMAAKRLELLRELVPNAETIAVLVNPGSPGAKNQLQDLQGAALALGLKLIFLNASSERDLEAAFTSLAKQRPGALLLTDNAVFNNRREQLVALAADHAIPTLFTFREFVEAGGLMSYASSLADSHRQVGRYVGRILKGESPSNLPVLQPTRFELVINLKTAKTLRLDIPAKLLALADEVIE